MTSVNMIDRYVGDRLRLRREALGMTAADFAGELNISAAQLGDYEAGAIRIDARILQKMARRLDVSPTFFFERVDLSPQPVGPENEPAGPGGGPLRGFHGPQADPRRASVAL